MRTYEGMFLLDSAQAVKDWDATVGVVTGVLERYGAKLGLNGKWDERKLTYGIKRQKRGTYYLAYFEAPTAAIGQIRHDLGLREEVLRCLILAWPDDQPLPETLETKAAFEIEDERGGRGRFRRDGQSDDDRRRSSHDDDDDNDGGRD